MAAMKLLTGSSQAALREPNREERRGLAAAGSGVPAAR